MQQTKTILFLARLYHPHIGGVEKHIAEISRLLYQQGYLVTIVVEQDDKNTKQFEIIDNIHIYRIPIPLNQYLKKFYIWKWMFLNLGIILKADIIHIHDVFYWILPLRPILFKKIYITFHGYESFPIKWRWILSRKIAEKLSSGSICVGDFMKKWYYTQPTSVIYGGVSVENKYPEPKENTAVFFGRLDDQTGIIEYIEAYKKIKEKIPSFQLTVIGEGPLRSKIPASIKVIKFTKNVEKYISENEFIFVSRYLSMLEALIKGRKIIAVYDNPIKRDYLLMSPFKKYIEIGKNGAEIAEIVINMVKYPKNITKQSKEGRIWAQKQTWDKIVGVYLRLWELDKN